MRLRGSWLIVAMALTLGLPGAGNAKTSIRFKLVNASPHTIRAAYVSAADKGQWGDSLLNGAPLPPGQSVTLVITGDCGSYDVRFVTDKKVEFLDEDVQFCDDDDVVTIDKSGIAKAKPAH